MKSNRYRYNARSLPEKSGPQGHGVSLASYCTAHGPFLFTWLFPTHFHAHFHSQFHLFSIVPVAQRRLWLQKRFFDCCAAMFGSRLTLCMNDFEWNSDFMWLEGIGLAWFRDGPRDSGSRRLPDCPLLFGKLCTTCALYILYYDKVVQRRDSRRMFQLWSLSSC